MKPHLPASLRRALIACLIALAPAARAYDLDWCIYNIYWGVGEYFSDSRLFLPRDNVTFGPLPSGTTETVTLLGSFQVGSMTVNAGEGNTYQFKGDGSIAETDSITITSGIAEFEKAELLPQGGADVQITAGGKLQLDYGAGTAYNLNIDLGTSGSTSTSTATLVLSGAPDGSTFTLNGNLSMGNGSVLQTDGGTWCSYILNADIEVAQGDTITMNTGNESAEIYLKSPSPPKGTIRIEGAPSHVFMGSTGTYKLDVANGSALFLDNEAVHADIEVHDGGSVLLQFNQTGSSTSLSIGDGHEIMLSARNADATVDQLTGGGTLVVVSGNVLLEEGGDFSGRIRVGGASYYIGSQHGKIEGDAALILGGAEVASRVDVELTEYETHVYSLALADGVDSAELKSLKGSASSRIKAGSYRIREGGAFAGTLENGVTLTVGAGSTMNLDGTRMESGASSLIVSEGGSTIQNLTLGSGMSLSSRLEDASQHVTLQDLTLTSGSTILFDAQNLSSTAPMYEMSGTTVLDTSGGSPITLVIHGAENLTMGDSYLLFGGVSTSLTGADPDQIFEVSSSLGSHVQYTLDAQSGAIKLILTPTPEYYRRSSSSHNGQAGAALAAALFAEAMPQYRDPGSDAGTLLLQLDSLIESGNLAAADNTMAAAAGASVTTLGIAFAADTQHRLNNIRDRISTLKLGTFGAPAADPGPSGRESLNFWVNAEESYLTLEQSGTAPGYRMTSWGGTVGIEISPRRDLSCGLAFSALYGDLDTDAADAASGELDTSYISAFGQYRSGAWKHTLVASLGLADISLNRSVTHGLGSYRTSGDTDGLSLGFLYELTRDISLNGANTAILQPLVNFSYLHTQIDGYTERGSDAALSFGDQNLDSVNFGAGARVQALAGENLLNRNALFEARALAKFNAGDRQSTAGVSFARGFGQAAVESAAMGVFGMELGAGVTMPLGREAGSIFVDVSYELYREYSSMNASAGYRLSF